MKTIDTSYIATTEVKRSKFISYLVPIEEYKGLQEKLKLQHPKARHVVYALRYLNEFEQIVENSSDDGEPKGSSATPMLNVLRGEEIINSALLIVRYFGGIKLGIGGLVRAYTLASKEVIAKANLISYEKALEYSFKTSYATIEKILYQLKNLEITKYERDFGITEVEWKIWASKEKLDIFKSYIS